MTFINKLEFPLILRSLVFKYLKIVIVLEMSMCFLIQKHVFVYFFNNQKLLILFNQIDVIVSKSFVKHIYIYIYIYNIYVYIYTYVCIYIYIYIYSFIDHSFEERR